jgi:ABC-type lipoprotein release transport system permease subunit
VANNEFKRKIAMRGALIIGLAVVLLIVAILVIKNMGNENPDGITETQVEAYTEKAQSAADNANQRIQDLRKQVTGSE